MSTEYSRKDELTEDEAYVRDVLVGRSLPKTPPSIRRVVMETARTHNAQRRSMSATGTASVGLWRRLLWARAGIAAVIAVLACVCLALIMFVRRPEDTTPSFLKAVWEKETSPSIAVLPFDDMSEKKDQEYFCDGMAEEIIGALSQLKDLRVIARASAFSFKGQDIDIRDISRKLNVDAILKGSVRKAGNTVRIDTQLVDARGGHNLWRGKYDRDMEGVFAIQDEITLAIVDKLKVKRLGEEKARLSKLHTADLEAYNLFLKGQYFANKITPEGLKKGIEFFEQAIEKDPDYALAYAHMANAYMVMAVLSHLPPNEACPKAREAALKALEMDETLAGAHSSLGLATLYYEGDWEGAEKEYKRAIELDPGYPLRSIQSLLQ
jgi:TolB-like protein